MWSEKGWRGSSRWKRNRRYSAITAASPGSDFAPETTSPFRQALMALGDSATTGRPASRRRSTSRRSGRSIATVSPPGSPNARRRATGLSNPSAECSPTSPRASTTWPTSRCRCASCSPACWSGGDGGSTWRPSLGDHRVRCRRRCPEVAPRPGSPAGLACGNHQGVVSLRPRHRNHRHRRRRRPRVRSRGPQATPVGIRICDLLGAGGAVAGLPRRALALRCDRGRPLRGDGRARDRGGRPPGPQPRPGADHGFRWAPHQVRADRWHPTHPSTQAMGSRRRRDVGR